MKILHYINNLGSGGAEKLLGDILPLMQQKGHEVYLLISNDDKNFKRNVEVIKKNNIPYKSLNTSFYNPIQIYALIKFIRKQNFDVVHAHLFPTQYWLAFASYFLPKRIKLVKTEHSVYNERKQYKVLRPLERLIYSRYKRIIAITPKVKENLADWLNDNNKIQVIPNGINLAEMQNASRQGIVFEFLSSKSYNILMVGRFDGWQKDQLTLIKALEYLTEDVKLYFAGQGPFLDNLKKEVEKRGLNNRVVFLGLRDDVYALMSSVDLNVLSTNHEGLSGVTLESLASGKPFIGSDVEGVQEVVPTKDFLFPANNPVALANKINQIREDETFRKKMIEKALTHVKPFDTSNMVERYINEYYKVLN